MSDARSLFESFFLFMALCILAFILDISIGHTIDVYLQAFANRNLFQDVTPAWDTSHILRLFVTEFHLYIYILPIMGLCQFIYVCVRRQRYDTELPETPHYV